MKVLTVKDAFAKYSDNNTIFIDIRGKDEFAFEKIEGAQNVLPDDLAQHDYADKEVIFYCKSGMRTKSIQDILQGVNAKEAFILEGGIDGWKKSSYPVLSTSKVLPLSQQVQLAISLLLMLGLSLSYFVSPWFSLIILFISLGLLMAGLTGFCGLGIFLSKMPWNRKKA